MPLRQFRRRRAGSIVRSVPTEMTRITDRRLFLAILAALHFVAAPCVMAMTSADGNEPCEHCGAGSGIEACTTTAADPGAGDQGPAPGRLRAPEPPGLFALLPAPHMAAATALSRAGPAARTGRETGRYTGDPPLTVLFGKFLN